MPKQDFAALQLSKNVKLNSSFDYMEAKILFPHLEQKIDYKGFVYAK